MKKKHGALLPTVLCAIGACYTAQSVRAEGESAIEVQAGMQQMASSEQVKNNIVRMVNAVDAKQWDVASAQFADEILVDYSSLTGLPAVSATVQDLVGGWKQLLQNVSTLHQLSNFDIAVEGNRAEVSSHVYASHSAEGIEHWDLYGRYHHTLSMISGQWKITGITLRVQDQKGNQDFLQQISHLDKTSGQVSVRKITFNSDGVQLVGNLYFPENYDADRQYPAVIVSGSWTTVKEQMSGHYAGKLAGNDFITLAFDHRNFGESGGEPRFYENPTRKIEDIHNAVTYLQSLPEVDNDRIGALGICAGAMYTLMAAAEDSRIKSVVTVASWLHDAEAVKLFYGGEEGVQARIDAAQSAKKLYAQTGVVSYIPSISSVDETAAMYGPYDYYLNPERGAVPEWSADKFAVMSWEDWLTLDPMPSAKRMQASTLMIHSDGAVLPQYTRTYFDNIATDDKFLYWIDTELESPLHQFSFYDQSPEVNESVAQAQQWLADKL